MTDLRNYFQYKNNFVVSPAVLNGELDTQIEAAALKLRDGFAQ